MNWSRTVGTEERVTHDAFSFPTCFAYAGLFCKRRQMPTMQIKMAKPIFPRAAPEYRLLSPRQSMPDVIPITIIIV